jgi:hypothetical protein
VCLQGQGTLEIDDQVIALEPGVAVLISPGMRHRARPAPGEHLRLMNIVVPPFPQTTSGSTRRERFVSASLMFDAQTQACIWDDCAGHLNAQAPWDLWLTGDRGAVRACEYFFGVPG